MCVSIPQAVSSFATEDADADALARKNVSIPQAVSAVATGVVDFSILDNLRFNTASGKRCCNYNKDNIILEDQVKVSIPQAVSAVAT